MSALTDRLWRVQWKMKALLTKEGMDVGTRFPDFELANLWGYSYRLRDVFPDRGAMLWLSNLCSGCEEKMPLVNRLARTYGEILQIFVISVLGEDRETPKRIQDAHRLIAPLLLDPDDWVGRVLGFEHPGGACPMFNVFVLDRSGVVIFRHHLSAVKEDRLETVIQSLAGPLA